MPQNDGSWKAIAGNFPPTLNREKNDTELEAGETPNAYGLDWDTDGLLAAIASEPTGDTRIVKTFSPASPASGGEVLNNPMTWLYNRLWSLDAAVTTKIRYGAPDYQSQYFAQRNGVIVFDEDAEPLLTFLPLEPQGLVVVKDSTSNTSGSYFIPDATRRDGKFEVLNIKQGFKANDATHLATHNGRVFCSNADGVFAFNGQQVEELTEAVRNNLGSFVGAPLTVDYDKNVLIGTGEYLIDLNNGKLFDYGSSGFLYTTPTIDMEDKAPFAVQRIAFLIDHDSTDGGDITFSVQLEEGGWGDDITLTINYDEDQYQRVEYDLDYNDIRSSRQWRMRITSLPTNIRIRDILIYSTDFEAQDYSA